VKADAWLNQGLDFQQSERMGLTCDRRRAIPDKRCLSILLLGIPGTVSFSQISFRYERCGKQNVVKATSITSFSFCARKRNGLRDFALLAIRAQARLKQELISHAFWILSPSPTPVTCHLNYCDLDAISQSSRSTIQRVLIDEPYSISTLSSSSML
jgi:hypothetical protein